MKYKVLCNNQPSEINLAIAEEKHNFILYVLSQMGLQFEEEFLNQISDLQNFNVALKEKFREILNKYSIQIIESIDGVSEIYLESDLIAKWNKPFLILKKDLGQIDPKKKLYIELNIDCWSMFEEEKDE